MKKDFDFDDIGKRTPYTVPDGFFNNVQQKVMARAGVKQRRTPSARLAVVAVMGMAALLAGLLFVPSFYRAEVGNPTSADVLAVESGNSAEQADGWIRELSDEELEELVSFSENDIFLN